MTAIEAGAQNTLALKSDGTVVAWGVDLLGETTVPAGLNNVIDIASGFEHAVALKSDGTVVAWGGNRFGELTVPAGLNVIELDAGYYHPLAIVSNRAPNLDDISDQSVDEAQTISIPISSTDPDGDALTLSATGLPSFCSLSDAGTGNGSIDCAPGFVDPGTYPITVTTTENNSAAGTDSDSFVLTVVEINDPPVVDAGANAAVTVPDAAQLAGSATDDGNPVPPGNVTFEWTVVSGAGNVIFDDVTSPTTSAIFEGGGDFVLRLTADDGLSQAFDDVTITVNNPLGCTIFGTNGPDELIGSERPDVICGFGGDDDIEGRGGDDTIFGGTGSDKMLGGGGNDIMSSVSGVNEFDGQGGDDTISGAGGPDQIRGSGGADTIFGFGGNDLLVGGPSGDTITGGGGDDEIRGGRGNDKLRDAAGDDQLFGEGGKDSLRDLIGTNTLDGGPGADRCTDAGGEFAC